MTRTLTLLIVVALGLSGCGRVAALKRTPGMKPLPVATGASRPATAEELIKPSSQARPGRNVDILVHSEKRRDDPFDIPPGPTNGRKD